MKVIIIEDELHAANKLERQLKSVDTDIELLAKIDSVESAVDWLRMNHTDLIFLDIHLGDALSFKIFEQVEVTTPIIFTTAYDQYAIQAFKHNSIDYLLKPVSQSELETALQKFQSQNLNQQTTDYQKLIDAFQNNQPDYQKRFMVYTGDKIKTVLVEDVAYFFAEGKYCYLVSHDKKEYLIDMTLDKLENALDPDQFFRINRQLYISLTSIDEMESYTKGRVKIKLKPHHKGEAVVSVDRSPLFKKWLNR